VDARHIAHEAGAVAYYFYATKKGRDGPKKFTQFEH
jgi:hypothetical protein